MQHVSVEGGQPYDWRHDRRLATCGVAAALLIAAGIGGPRADGFYTFLRIYVSGVAAVLALYDWRRGKVWLPLSAILIAILFNPIKPIEMYQSHWQPYDWGAAGWFAAVAGFPLARTLPSVVKAWALAAAVIGALAIPLLLALSSTKARYEGNTMDVDENLTTTDMNIDANFTTPNIYATNVSAAPAIDLNELANAAAENAEADALAAQQAQEQVDKKAAEDASLDSLRERLGLSPAATLPNNTETSETNEVSSAQNEQ